MNICNKHMPKWHLLDITTYHGSELCERQGCCTLVTVTNLNTYQNTTRILQYYSEYFITTTFEYPQIQMSFLHNRVG